MPAFASQIVRRTALASATVALGALAACATSTMVPPQSTAVGVRPSNVRTVAEPTGEPPLVVVRDYWGAPSAAVVAWSPDDDTQGLRTEVRRDGSIVHDHQVYLSTYALPNYRAFANAEWHAFANSKLNDGVNGSASINGTTSKADRPNKSLVNDRNNDIAQPLLTNGVNRDIMNCKGAKACSPYETFSARVSDTMLRSVSDSLVIKVRARNGAEEVVVLDHDLITSYLRTVDSLSNFRRLATATAHHR